MIKFNTLKITEDSKNLIIDAEIEDLSYYDDMLISSLIIDNQDTYSALGPSSNPIVNLSFAKTDSTGEEIKGVRHVSIEIPLVSLKEDLGNDILYIYFTTVGTPAPNTPCNKDLSVVMGVAVNLYPIYMRGMSYIKELSKDCTIPKGFIDYILNYRLIELCLKTRNYVTANKYWNKFFKNVKNITVKTSDCGCSK